MELGQHAQQHTIRTLADGQPGAAVGAQEGHLYTLQGRVERLESIGSHFGLAHGGPQPLRRKSELSDQQPGRCAK